MSMSTIRRQLMRLAQGQHLNIVQTTVFRSLLQKHYRHFSNSVKDMSESQEGFGICFDIDGVLTRGHVPFEEAVAALNLLKNETDNKFKYPVTFVTNALAPRTFKAKQLEEWFLTQVDPDQVIMTQTGLKMFRHIRKKKILMMGQAPLQQIADDMKFEDVCFFEDLSDAYPLLDISLHNNGNKESVMDHEEKYFPPVEVIVLMGEPKHWESPLQILIDLLLTEGQPSKGKPRQNKQTVPVYACNVDLQYMHKASFPRFGHGAFLLCLEALFKKLTGTDLKYEAMIGKPSEVTMRFTEHRLSLNAQRIGYTLPIKTMYMVGDNKDVDITAANMYQNYIDFCDGKGSAYDIPAFRMPPNPNTLLPQTVKQAKGILVKTGVYQAEHEEGSDNNNHGHRDFPLSQSVKQPYIVKTNVYDAVKFILEKQNEL